MSTLEVAYTLNPITPTQVDRFKPIARSVVGNNSSALGFPSKFGGGRSLVSGGAVTHPEGSLIYYDDRLISCQPITSTHRNIGASILSRCSGAASNARVTVFIEIRNRSQADYYIAAHDFKMILWIDQQLPDCFSGAPPSKHDHEYWIHMENFPGPVFSTSQDRQELVNVMASTAVDAATSDGSTSPMSAEQLHENLETIKRFSEEIDIYQTYAIARLWNMLLQSRVINKYGTPEARLDRFITISERPPKFTGIYEKVNKLMLHTPHAHLVRCARAWADRIAYTQEWRKLKARNEQEWQQVMHLACVLIMRVKYPKSTECVLTALCSFSASLLVNSQSTCSFKVISNFSLLTGLGSLASVYYLLNESQNLGHHAADASTYFQEREEYAYGVQRIAIINAMPQALLIWGFIFFLAAVLI
ncbi:transmembrane protein [Ceratobasidium sp. AG-Ba]|nr:transmembrane protein [Ceratobasidium sp. AG-Ba]